MHLRRPSALAATALALATVLTSCGFDYATDRVYTPAAGTLSRDADVDVLSAAVVADSDGAGTFIAGLSNNLGDAEITFTSLTPDDGETFTVGEFEPITLAPLGFANLSEPGEGIEITGEFEAGQFLSVALSFDNGETVRMDVPVVTACDMFEGFDTASETAEEAGEEAYDCEPLEPVVEFGHGEGH
jgi:hypothetical protein